MKRHHRLEQAARPRRTLGVPDLRLDRAECAPLPVRSSRFVEHLAQRGELGGVAGPGAGAVRLDEPHRFRAVAGSGVGAAKGFRLTRRTGCVDALGPAVRRRADAADHRVDPVAVALGIVETLEREHRQPLAEHRAVRLVGEGPAVPAGRQRGDLREAHVHEDVVEGVDSTGDDHVRLTQVQLVQPHLQRGQRAGARRVDDAVGPAEIEAVGDAPGYDVAEQSGEGVLLPRRVVSRHTFAERGQLLFREAGRPKSALPDRPVQTTTDVGDQLGAAGGAEHDADSLTVDVR
ncbi:hypothetical protein BN973_02180 [Mycobacterium triplex]|uniref:Uncharacterized protein n=1 Tax=Mycobacterium triplex TaxID=47839 RepID=A0A024JWV0_9MYCO|nr:hypothetical protein BN973_02180 [Mycobacterium triplex]